MGPTGALSGVLAAASSVYGPGILPYVALIGGVISMLVWIAGIADYLMFIPSSVVHGFTAGVALILCFSQMDSALGMTVVHHEKEFVGRVWESIQAAVGVGITPCIYIDIYIDIHVTALLEWV